MLDHLVDRLAMDGLTLEPLKYWQYEDKEDELGDLMLKMMSYNRKRLSLASVRSRTKIATKSRKVQALTPCYFDNGNNFDDNGNKFVQTRVYVWCM
jgi:hypothetical protein